MHGLHVLGWTRRLRPAFVLLCLLVVQGGCVQVTPTPEPATITFVCSEEEEDHYKPLIDAFREEHGHITIDLVRPSRYSWPEADVFEVSPFTRRFMLRDDFQTLDLTAFMEQGESFERQDFYPGLIEMFLDEEDEIWAVPYMVEVWVMYYNRDLFDRHRLPYPELEWTWDDFLRAGQALYDPSAGVFGYTPDEEKNDPVAFVYQNGGRIFDDWRNPTRTTFDDPLTIEALDWYAKLMFEREAAATPVQARKAYGIGGPIQAGIKQGRLGMWSGGLSDRGGRLDREGWGVNWGIAPLPKGKQSATFSGVSGYAISAGTAHPDASWQWVAFLTRQNPRYGMPVRRSLVESERFEDEVGRDVAAVARASIEHALLFNPAGWDIYGSFQTFNEALEKIYSGGVSAAEAMEWAQEQSQYD